MVQDDGTYEERRTKNINAFTEALNKAIPDKVFSSEHEATDKGPATGRGRGRGRGRGLSARRGRGPFNRLEASRGDINIHFYLDMYRAVRFSTDVLDTFKVL